MYIYIYYIICLEYLSQHQYKSSHCYRTVNNMCNCYEMSITRSKLHSVYFTHMPRILSNFSLYTSGNGFITNNARYAISVYCMQVPTK